MVFIQAPPVERRVRVVREPSTYYDDDEEIVYVEPPARRRRLIRRAPIQSRPYVYVDETPRKLVVDRRPAHRQVVYIDDDRSIPYEEEIIYVDQDGNEIDYIYDEPSSIVYRR